MAPETRLILARFATALLTIVVAAVTVLLYEYLSEGAFDEATHRLSISYSSASSSLVGR